MQEDNKIVNMPHNLILEERKKLSVSGVTDVDSFDEQTLEQGELTLEGEISSLTYTDIKPKSSGFFSKILR